MVIRIYAANIGKNETINKIEGKRFPKGMEGDCYVNIGGRNHYR
jgi:hypothetical protein